MRLPGSGESLRWAGICLLGALCAQGAANARGQEGRIRLDVVVTDKAGSPVAWLERSDFTLLEDNRPVEVLSYGGFDGGGARPDPAVEVILLIDTVNNDFTELAFLRDGVEKFLRQNGGRLAQPVSILVFKTDGVEVLSRASRDGNALAAAVHQMKASLPPVGVDPYPLSIMALLHIAQDEAKRPGRKMLLWPGSGWPTPMPDPQLFTVSDERNQSSQFHVIVSLSTLLREAHIALYGGYGGGEFFSQEFLKGVKTAAQADPRNLSLDVLALENGGHGLLPLVNRDAHLDQYLNSFLAEANTFYTLSFAPPATDRADEYHELKVVVGRPGLTAHCATGYYNQPGMNQRGGMEAKHAGEDANRAGIPQGGRSAAVRRVTVAQLEQELRDAKSLPDASVAQRLNGMELSERLRSSRMQLLKTAMPGPDAKAALVLLADMSAFLLPPQEEITAEGGADVASQRRIVGLAVDYLRNTVPKLPNFYATRTTTRFDNTAGKSKHTGKVAPTSQHLHGAGSSSTTVTYTDGKEVADRETAKTGAEEQGLVTRGTFGPILTTVMVDAAHGDMTLTRWEKDEGDSEAVFRYSVPKARSHYEVAYRTGATKDRSGDLHQMAGYHGEITIDSATGAIRRLTVEADFDPSQPIMQADIVVEYGAVEIGGRSYICPLRSVSLSTTGRGLVLPDTHGKTSSLGIPGVTRLNDVAFTNYHVFRAEMKIVTGEDGAPQ